MYISGMRNAAAYTCLLVCAFSFGINTYQQKWFLVVVYLIGGIFFWNAIESDKK